MVFRTRQVFAAVALAAAAGSVLGGGSAEAQTFPESATARGVTVTTRQRPEYDPLGVRLGGFRLDAAAELGLGYDDNLFGTRNNRTDDVFFGDLLSASIESDWTTHAVGLTGRFEERRYFEETSQDWRDWSVGGFGRYDFDRNTSVQARYSHVRTRLDVQSIDVQQVGIRQPVPYDIDDFQIGVNTAFNRLSLSGLADYSVVRYEDVDIGGVRRAVSDSNYNSLLGAIGLGYAIAPGRLVTLVGRVQDIQYERAISRGRDSFTWEVLVGFQYDFDGVWQARGGIGYRQREYDSPNLPNLEGPAFEGTVIWAPTQLTTVTLAARRSIEESINQNAVSYTRTLGQVSVDHELRRNVILGAALSVDYRSYDQPDINVTDGIGVLSARWLLNRNMSVVGSYQHVQRLNATGGAQEYARNLFQVRLRFAL